jgi:hypothetical protein
MIRKLAGLGVAALAVQACSTAVQDDGPAGVRHGELAVPAGISEAQVEDVLERLRTARRLARGAGPLPFSLSCTDETDSGICGGGGRAALASLPLDRVQSVRPIYNTSCVRVLFEYPGDRCPRSVAGRPRRIDAWEIHLPHAAGGGYTWVVGLAPAQGIAAIELERGTVVYH